MTAAPPLVSVVIPTTLRAELEHAIHSAKHQSIGSELVEVIVVVDYPDTAGPVPEADVVLFTGGAQGAAVARNLGVEAARGEWIAFLDDDDSWSPEKLAIQLRAARRVVPNSPGLVVVSTRVLQSRAGSTALSRPVPRRLINRGERPEDYLFRRRSPAVDRQSLFTSTLLVGRDLARLVDWSPELRRHQDWDWLVRANRAGAVVLHVPEALVTINVGSASSISGTPDWKSSLDWVRLVQSDWDRQTTVDFIAAQTLRYVLQARSWEGLKGAVAAMISTRRVPSIGPVLIGAAGLLSRARFNRVMLRSSRSSPRELHDRSAG